MSSDQQLQDEAPPSSGSAASVEGSTINEQLMWRNWDGKTPWPGPTPQSFVYDGGHFFPSFTLEGIDTGYYSDESDILNPENRAHLDLDDVPEDPWRQDYLEFIIAQRQCSSRRQAANRPPASCTRHQPCDDCSFHPGASATSVHWQCMNDARLELELDAYMQERSGNVSPWVPPSPTSSSRRFPPPRLIFGEAQRAEPPSNQASCSSTRSNSPSPAAATLPSAASLHAQPPLSRPVFGPPRPPPVQDDLSDC